MVLARFFPLIFALVGYVAPTFAQSQSVLVSPPPRSAAYSLPWSQLSSAQRHSLSLFGLRLVPLDPDVWGLRDVDVTESKNLIPIRPFYLRVSEDPSFRVRHISFVFQFKKTPDQMIKRYPRENDPLLEVGFASSVLGSDAGYALRLSGFPPLSSGIWARHGDRYSLVVGAPLLNTGQPYKVDMRFSAEQVLITLDDKPFCESRGSTLDRGLISLQTSWAPVSIAELAIDGRLVGKGSETALHLSGIVTTGPIPAGRK